MILLGFNLDFSPRLCIAGTWPSLAHAVVAVALLVGHAGSRTAGGAVAQESSAQIILLSLFGKTTC